MDRCISRMAYVLKNMTKFSYVRVITFNSLHWKELLLERKVLIFNLDGSEVLPQCLMIGFLVIDFKGKEVYILK